MSTSHRHHLRSSERCSRNATVWAACGLVPLLLAAGALADDPVEADILLKNGTIVDGTGRPGSVGDVAVRGDRIVAVGAFETAGHPQQIDCTGLVIAPGFIDLHNHSDRAILDPQTRANVNYIVQGCTTIVTGNCGAGPVDAGKFYKEIETQGAGTNVMHLVPHGSLRDDVMGSANRAPTDDELAEMKRLTAKAMADGCWGLSTGLIYVPGSYSTTDELVALSEVVATAGGIYASHMRNEGTELLHSTQELLEIGRRAGLPVHISHFKSSGRDAWGLIREAAKMIETARESGQIVTADQYPYIASSTSLDATVIPTWARAGGRDEMVARFDDAEQGMRIREEIAETLSKKDDGAQIRIARYSPRPEWVSKNLHQIAEAEQISPVELCLQIARCGGAQIVNFSMQEEDVRFAMELPWVATASDGRAALPAADRPHPRYYGTFARKIGHYSLQENVIPLEQAIRSASGLPAEIIGLSDRGRLAQQTFADIIVFDPKTYIDRATFDDPHRYAAGVRYVFVNGQPAVVDGVPTGALTGRALRHASPPADDQPTSAN
jgi:N-acyl-D-amino-acid deacylase